MKALFYGIALAAFSGVAAGAALKPALHAITDDITSSPPGVASSVIIDQASAGPDYSPSGPWVMGSDYLKTAEPLPVQAYMGDAEPYEVAISDQPAAPIEPASTPEMSGEPRYPSQGGGIIDAPRPEGVVAVIPIIDPA